MTIMTWPTWGPSVDQLPMMVSFHALLPELREQCGMAPQQCTN